MEFSNIIKGAVTETAIACLLRQAGYPVFSSAIETLIPVLPTRSKDAYDALQLGRELRLLPDLLILPEDAPASEIEVKFRSRLEREGLRQLHEKLRAQQEAFPRTHTILIRGISPRGESARADDLIRVLPPQRLELLSAADLFYHTCAANADGEEARLEPLWQALRPITAAFDRLQSHREQLERLVPLIRTLAEL